MWRRDALILLAAVSLACGGGDSPATATAQTLPFSLALVDGEPAIAFNPATGLALAARDIQYDDFGGIRSYVAVFASSNGDTTVALVSDADTSTAPDARRFEARSGDRTITAVSSGDSPSSIAFLPKDPGGVQLKGADSVVTEFSYDSFGRQQVAFQVFRLGTERWRVDFSGFARDGAGRFAAVALKISKGGP